VTRVIQAGDEKCIQNVWLENLKGSVNFEGLSVDGRKYENDRQDAGFASVNSILLAQYKNEIRVSCERNVEASD
jgi:hypothetical protein